MKARKFSSMSQRSSPVSRESGSLSVLGFDFSGSGGDEKGNLSQQNYLQQKIAEKQSGGQIDSRLLKFSNLFNRIANKSTAISKKQWDACGNEIEILLAESEKSSRVRSIGFTYKKLVVFAMKQSEIGNFLVAEDIVAQLLKWLEVLPVHWLSSQNSSMEEQEKINNLKLQKQLQKQTRNLKILTLNTKGQISRRQGQFSKAMDCFLEAEKIGLQGSSEYLGVTYLHLSSLCGALGNHKLALEHASSGLIEQQRIVFDSSSAQIEETYEGEAEESWREKVSDLCLSYFNAAAEMEAENRWEESLKHYEYSYSSACKHFGKTNPLSIQFFEQLTLFKSRLAKNKQEANSNKRNSNNFENNRASKKNCIHSSHSPCNLRVQQNHNKHSQMNWQSISDGNACCNGGNQQLQKSKTLQNFKMNRSSLRDACSPHLKNRQLVVSSSSIFKQNEDVIGGQNSISQHDDIRQLKNENLNYHNLPSNELSSIKSITHMPYMLNSPLNKSFSSPKNQQNSYFLSSHFSQDKDYFSQSIIPSPIISPKASSETSTRGDYRKPIFGMNLNDHVIERKKTSYQDQVNKGKHFKSNSFSTTIPNNNNKLYSKSFHFNNCNSNCSQDDGLDDNLKINTNSIILSTQQATFQGYVDRRKASLRKIDINSRSFNHFKSIHGDSGNLSSFQQTNNGTNALMERITGQISYPNKRSFLRTDLSPKQMQLQQLSRIISSSQNSRKEQIQFIKSDLKEEIDRQEGEGLNEQEVHFKEDEKEKQRSETLTSSVKQLKNTTTSSELCDLVPIISSSISNNQEGLDDSTLSSCSSLQPVLKDIVIHKNGISKQAGGGELSRLKPILKTQSNTKTTANPNSLSQLQPIYEGQPQLESTMRNSNSKKRQTNKTVVFTEEQQHQQIQGQQQLNGISDYQNYCIQEGFDRQDCTQIPQQLPFQQVQQQYGNQDTMPQIYLQQQMNPFQNLSNPLNFQQFLLGNQNTQQQQYTQQEMFSYQQQPLVAEVFEPENQIYLNPGQQQPIKTMDLEHSTRDQVAQSQQFNEFMQQSKQQLTSGVVDGNVDNEITAQESISKGEMKNSHNNKMNQGHRQSLNKKAQFYRRSASERPNGFAEDIALKKKHNKQITATKEENILNEDIRDNRAKTSGTPQHITYISELSRVIGVNQVTSETENPQKLNEKISTTPQNEESQPEDFQSAIKQQQQQKQQIPDFSQNNLNQREIGESTNKNQSPKSSLAIKEFSRSDGQKVMDSVEQNQEEEEEEEEQQQLKSFPKITGIRQIESHNESDSQEDNNKLEIINLASEAEQARKIARTGSNTNKNTQGNATPSSQNQHPILNMMESMKSDDLWLKNSFTGIRKQSGENNLQMFFAPNNNNISGISKAVNGDDFESESEVMSIQPHIGRFGSNEISIDPSPKEFKNINVPLQSQLEKLITNITEEADDGDTQNTNKLMRQQEKQYHVLQKDEDDEEEGEHEDLLKQDKQLQFKKQRQSVHKIDEKKYNSQDQQQQIQPAEQTGKAGSLVFVDPLALSEQQQQQVPSLLKLNFKRNSKKKQSVPVIIISKVSSGSEDEGDDEEEEEQENEVDEEYDGEDEEQESGQSDNECNENSQETESDSVFEDEEDEEEDDDEQSQENDSMIDEKNQQNKGNGQNIDENNNILNNSDIQNEHQKVETNKEQGQETIIRLIKEQSKSPEKLEKQQHLPQTQSQQQQQQQRDSLQLSHSISQHLGITYSGLSEHPSAQRLKDEIPVMKKFKELHDSPEQPKANRLISSYVSSVSQAGHHRGQPHGGHHKAVSQINQNHFQNYSSLNTNGGSMVNQLQTNKQAKKYSLPTVFSTSNLNQKDKGTVSIILESQPDPSSFSETAKAATASLNFSSKRCSISNKLSPLKVSSSQTQTSEETGKDNTNNNIHSNNNSVSSKNIHLESATSIKKHMIEYGGVATSIEDLRKKEESLTIGPNENNNSLTPKIKEHRDSMRNGQIPCFQNQIQLIQQIQQQQQLEMQQSKSKELEKAQQLQQPQLLRVKEEQVNAVMYNSCKRLSLPTNIVKKGYKEQKMPNRADSLFQFNSIVNQLNNNEKSTMSNPTNMQDSNGQDDQKKIANFDGKMQRNTQDNNNQQQQQLSTNQQQQQYWKEQQSEILQTQPQPQQQQPPQSQQQSQIQPLQLNQTPDSIEQISSPYFTIASQKHMHYQAFSQFLNHQSSLQQLTQPQQSYQHQHKRQHQVNSKRPKRQSLHEDLSQSQPIQVSIPASQAQINLILTNKSKINSSNSIQIEHQSPIIMRSLQREPSLQVSVQQSQLQQQYQQQQLTLQHPFSPTNNPNNISLESSSNLESAVMMRNKVFTFDVNFNKSINNNNTNNNNTQNSRQSFASRRSNQSRQSISIASPPSFPQLIQHGIPQQQFTGLQPQAVLCFQNKQSSRRSSTSSQNLNEVPSPQIKQKSFFFQP